MSAAAALAGAVQAAERPTAPYMVAQATAADSLIKSAEGDLDRLEKQAAALKAGSSSVKRAQKLLALTEKRLSTSKNQSHPSWVEANQRLQALKQRLADLAAGKRPAAAPKAASQPAAPKPAAATGGKLDPKIAKSMAEIRNLDAAVGAMAPGDKVKGGQYVKDLNAIAAQLKAYPNRKDPNWAAAARAYNALNQKLSAKVKAAGGSQPATAASGGKADPKVASAGREIDIIARRIKDLRPAEIKDGMRFHKNLGRIAGVLNAAQDKSHPLWRETVSKFRNANNHIVTTLMKGINERQGKLATKLDGMSELALLSKKPTDQAKREIERLWKDAAALGAPKHGDVKTFITAFKAMENKHYGRIDAALDAHKALGDVKAEVAAIEQRMNGVKVPQPLREPYSADAIKAYAVALKQVQEVSAKDLAYLKRIKGKTPLVDKDTMSRLLRWVGRKPDDAQKSAQQTVQAVDAWADVGMRQVKFLATTDVSDRDHVANRLLGPGQREKTLAELKDAIERVKTAAIFDAAMARSASPDRAAQQNKLEKVMADYEGWYKTALGQSRMPKAAQSDAKYIKIAKQTLAKPKYKSVNPHERIVINSKVRRKEKKEGVLSRNVLTVYHFVWDQYQVATAEKTGDVYHIWYTTLKYLYKGGPTTPTEAWIISGRHQSIRILKQNISK